MTGFTRRMALALIGAAAATGPAIGVAHAAQAGRRKFVFGVMRGGLDGLAALIPDDREMAALRPNILPAQGDRLDLGNGFRLHPALSGLHGLYRSGEAAFVHAAATPYRARSHFDGQDVLETLGAPGTREGWLNRAVGAAGGSGLAVGYAVPLALKGPAPATNWSPPVFAEASDDLLDRLADLYADDPVLASPLAMARAAPAAMDDMDGLRPRGGPEGQFRAAGEALGRLMAAEGGPAIGMVSFDGWDTHANQPGALANRLAALDGSLGALKAALGPGWADTVVVLASEFGRTAAENGSRGTDHGTGGLVILTGGAVRGGRVHGDWPGLARGALHEGRDLAPANDLTGVLKGVLRDHLGLDRKALDTIVLPGPARPMDGLLRA